MKKQNYFLMVLLAGTLIFQGCGDDETEEIVDNGNDGDTTVVEENDYLFRLEVDSGYETEEKSFVTLSDDNGEVFAYEEYNSGDQIEIAVPEGYDGGTYNLTLVGVSGDDIDINTYMGINVGQDWKLIADEEGEDPVVNTVNLIYENLPVYEEDYDNYRLITNAGYSGTQREIPESTEIEFEGEVSPLIVVLTKDGEEGGLPTITYKRYELVAGQDLDVDLSGMEEATFAQVEIGDLEDIVIYTYGFEGGVSYNLTPVSTEGVVDGKAYYAEFDDLFSSYRYVVSGDNELMEYYSSSYEEGQPLYRSLGGVSNVTFDDSGATADIDCDCDLAYLIFSTGNGYWYFYGDGSQQSYNVVDFPEEIDSLLPEISLANGNLYVYLNEYNVIEGYAGMVEYLSFQKVFEDGEKVDYIFHNYAFNN